MQGCRVENRWVSPRSTQFFILPRSIKWVPGTSGNLVVKSKLPPWSGSVALGQLKPIHRRGDKVCFLKKQSSIDIEVIRTVFNFIFFMKKILSIWNTNKKHLTNIQPNISINKKASKLTFNQIFLKAKKRLSNIHSNKYLLKSI